mmetsp:Transcript_14115/g.31501  ORF Transcript_14115/g.31501 Transcript_14115/m.31501 type:complete len:222 (-) Transcript_14115:895-1560(-)
MHSNQAFLVTIPGTIVRLQSPHHFLSPTSRNKCAVGRPRRQQANLIGIPSTVEASFATDRLLSGGGGAQPPGAVSAWIVNAIHIPLASSASAHGTQIPEGLSPAAKYEHGGDDDGADVFPCTVRRIPPPPCDGNANAYDKGTERKQRTHHRSKRPPPKHQPEIQTEKGGAVPGSDRTYPSRLTSRGLILPIRPRCDIVRQRLAAQARGHPGRRRTGQRGIR